ncbi:MAG: shikimate kinase [Blastocatellia bacterium]
MRPSVGEKGLPSNTGRSPSEWLGLSGRSIYLLGFMAAGKTSVGPVLARLLNRRFLDLDQEIEVRAGCSIASLIERDGEPAFRDRETDLLRETLTEEPRVIAPGGGAILRAENRQMMKLGGITVWLDAPFELCWQRIQQDGANRPLARHESMAYQRYLDRLPLYQQAKVRIPVEAGTSPESLAVTILEAIHLLAGATEVGGRDQ